MKRREFTASAAGLGLGWGLLGATPALAQGAAPVEGKDFVKLSTTVPVPSGGKIDVIEFFWYGCPHCNAFEPMLEPWAKRLPADVAFRRVPVSFSAMHETHAKIYYALESLGALDAMHRKVFAAIHVQQMRLDKEADIVAFMEKNGVEAAKFTEAFKSFGVATKVRQGKQLSEGYKIDGVPSLGIAGRWFTAPSLTGSQPRALQVADALIERARKSA
jgi:thiol:disulfide interchange protein DsbA